MKRERFYASKPHVFLAYDEGELLRMLELLFDVLPPRGPASLERAQEAYLTELLVIPWYAVSVALRRIVDSPEPDTGRPRKYAPPVTEIRSESARALREWRRFNNGQDPEQQNPHCEVEADLERELTLSRVRLLTTESNSPSKSRFWRRSKRRLPEEIDLGRYKPTD